MPRLNTPLADVYAIGWPLSGDWFDHVTTDESPAAKYRLWIWTIITTIIITIITTIIESLWIK